MLIAGRKFEMQTTLPLGLKSELTGLPNTLYPRFGKRQQRTDSATFDLSVRSVWQTCKNLFSRQVFAGLLYREINVTKSVLRFLRLLLFKASANGTASCG